MFLIYMKTIANFSIKQTQLINIQIYMLVIWFLEMPISTILLLSFTPSSTYKPCGKYNGKNIYEGKDGGCYYLKGKEHRKI